MSPSGIESFNKHANAIKARRNASGGDGQRVNYFSISDGDVARVRFLEQGDELTWAQTHRLKNKYGNFNNVLCVDQNEDGTSCPACQSDNFDIRKRSTRGFINLIWRGNEDEGLTRAPVYKRTEKGAVEKNAQKQKIITGYEDSVFMWECTKTVYEELLENDADFKGLMSRDFNIKRKGSGMSDTSYSIKPSVIEGGPEPLTIADATMSQNKFDLVALTTPDPQGMVGMLSSPQQPAQQETFSRNQQSDQSDVFNGEPVRSSAFNR